MPGLIENMLFGSGLALAAALQPGPLQAFLISRVVARGWRHTLPACLAPLLSDGPIALVAIVLVGRLPLAAQLGLRAAGGVLLLYLAWRAFRAWREPATSPQVSTPRTLAEAVLVNLLNPNPYLAWALILGPAVLAAWRRDPGHALALVASFYVTMVLTLALFVFLVGGVRFLGPSRQQVLVGVSAALPAVLGVLLLAAALGELRAGPAAGQRQRTLSRPEAEQLDLGRSRVGPVTKLCYRSWPGRLRHDQVRLQCRRPRPSSAEPRRWPLMRADRGDEDHTSRA